MDKVSYFQRAIENGITRPSLVQATDSKEYVLKARNEEGTNGKTLLNELIGYRLGKLLDVPMPNLKLLRLEKDFIENNDFYRDIGAKSGICVGSEYLKGNAKVNPVILDRASNVSDIPGIILFDQVIMNNDRAENDGNLFFERKTKKIIAIDHSHVFTSDIWDVGQINRLNDTIPSIVKNIDGQVYKYCSPFVNGNSPFHYCKMKYDSITLERLDEVFSDIPLEWNISEEEIIGLKEFVWGQIQHIDEILEEMKPHFSYWKGSV